MTEQAQTTREEHVLARQAEAIRRLRRAVAKKITYAKGDGIVPDEILTELEGAEADVAAAEREVESLIETIRAGGQAS
jgi:hypothetical protein